MIDIHSKKGQPWTEAEIKQLRRMAGAGLYVRQMAVEMSGRTESGIRDALARHGIPFKRETKAIRPYSVSYVGSLPASRYPTYDGMTVTALLMGDPPVGRSALDRIRAGVSA